MTIKECIDIVDNAKPNQYTIKEKVMWLSFVDETIINDVLKTHEGYDGRYDDFTGYTEDKLSVPLIVPSPYDRLYPQYIKMMIDSENGETARYNNSAALYNTYLTEYKKWYNKTHMPINGTLKAPSPVNININSALSEAQIENIKRQLYYMLSEDFAEATSRDKLYDIVTNYVLNNLEMLKSKLSMMYKGEVKTLPETAKTGEVYKIAEAIYEKDKILVPGGEGIGNLGAADADNGVSRIYFDRHYPWENIYNAWYLTEKMSFIADGVTYSADVVALNNDEGYIDIKNEPKNFFSAIESSTTFVIPDEYIEKEFLQEFRIVLCCKGECVVFDNDKWEKLGTDELANIYINLSKINFDTDRRLTHIDELVDDLRVYKADNDLSNVSNEDFRAKAEEAGVGGDAGLTGEGCVMKFMLEVTSLPETANDGEVYAVSPWESAGTYDGSGTEFNDNNVRFLDWNQLGAALYDDVQYHYGWTYKFVLNGEREIIYNDCGVSSAGEWGFEMSGYSNPPISGFTASSGTSVEVFRLVGESTDSASYVRFNGKWIKL